MGKVLSSLASFDKAPERGAFALNSGRGLLDQLLRVVSDTHMSGVFEHAAFTIWDVVRACFAKADSVQMRTVGYEYLQFLWTWAARSRVAFPEDMRVRSHFAQVLAEAHDDERVAAGWEAAMRAAVNRLEPESELLSDAVMELHAEALGRIAPT
ncbi:MAG: hypothetical protein O3B65_06475 [Chloroflexi bacterium]|nr:hypothetical protein [Chloroflexota bacterium]